MLIIIGPFFRQGPSCTFPVSLSPPTIQYTEMKTARELLDELNSLDESARIEAKAGSQVDRSIHETICAFANEPGLDGGYLLLGVRAQETLFDVKMLNKMKEHAFALVPILLKSPHVCT